MRSGTERIQYGVHTLYIDHSKVKGTYQAYFRMDDGTSTVKASGSPQDTRDNAIMSLLADMVSQITD